MRLREPRALPHGNPGATCLQRRFKDLAADGQQTPSCLLSLSGDGLSLVTLEVQDAGDLRLFAKCALQNSQSECLEARSSH